MQDIKTVTIKDKNFPESLKKIPSAPKTLYYIGTLPSLKEKCFAVVGTRNFSDYGKETALQITGDLCNAGLSIVSGLAPGIDTFAHTACVQKKARAIAVLGTGLDEKSFYPKENQKLAEKILEYGGCLISEYPEGTRGTKFTFPDRNRIVSGLSLGVLVVEAKEKSGSLITAGLAKKQGKKLFAVPGQIFFLNAKGPNKLIKAGAFLTESAEDILKELNMQGQTKINLAKKQAENIEEKIILNALKTEPLYIDKIIEKTKLEASAVATTLALMEISGKIRCLGGNVYTVS